MTGLAAAGGALYVADAGNNRIRRVDVRTGAITTVAGGAIGHADGSFTGDARFDRPAALAYDAASRVLVVADAGNMRLRRLDTATSQATTARSSDRP